MTTKGDKKKIGVSCFSGEDCPIRFDQIGTVVKIDYNDGVEQIFTIKFDDGKKEKLHERYCYPAKEA